LKLLKETAPHKIQNKEYYTDAICGGKHFIHLRQILDLRLSSILALSASDPS